MKKIYSIILAALFSTSIINSQNTLITGLTLTGILDLTVPAGGSSGKAIQLTANQNISDLFQTFLQENKLSSHAWVIGKKPDKKDD